MGTYRVAHGSVKQGKKTFRGDKAKPGKGEVLEMEDKTATALIAAGVLEPIHAAKAHGQAPDAKAAAAAAAAAEAEAEAKAKAETEAEAEAHKAKHSKGGK